MTSIRLLQGQFSKTEALDIITQMIHVKVKYHENKIHHSHNEEDIKMRESRIRQLQKELYELKNQIEQQSGKISLSSEIQVN
jgi:hypothetical protein